MILILSFIFVNSVLGILAKTEFEKYEFEIKDLYNGAKYGIENGVLSTEGESTKFFFSQSMNPFGGKLCYRKNGKSYCFKDDRFYAVPNSEKDTLRKSELCLGNSGFFCFLSAEAEEKVDRFYENAIDEFDDIVYTTDNYLARFENGDLDVIFMRRIQDIFEYKFIPIKNITWYYDESGKVESFDIDEETAAVAEKEKAKVVIEPSLSGPSQNFTLKYVKGGRSSRKMIVHEPKCKRNEFFPNDMMLEENNYVDLHCLIGGKRRFIKTRCVRFEGNNFERVYYKTIDAQFLREDVKAFNEEVIGQLQGSGNGFDEFEFFKNCRSFGD